ncbi:MAG: VanZ family protein [Acidobacteria bacterium]|nr:VanZ family protein [Acidobacteriota bacterium]
MIRIENRHARVALLAAWIGLIFFSSTDVAANWAEGAYNHLFQTLDLSSSAGTHLLTEKGFHAFLFLVLGWLVSPFPSGGKPRRIVTSVLWCFVVGTVSEGLQFFFAGRDPRLSDVLLNGLSGTLTSFLRICA